ncbi:CRE-SRD-32 protein [Caenorhabditis remanei]|uniref:CRE-SRD-32 protein n=2 Tax=Caenorhabditis remanei TaxID=31234 RepID=E3LK24_CAERE|nr:CRE-SRD-32 protein [Caenorhabditis remanei]
MFVDIYDQLYISYASVVSTLGVLFNGFLLFLIFFKSPSCLTPYTVFLANTSITQLLYSLCFILTVPRVISINLRIVNIYLGFSQFLGHWWSYMIFTTMLHFAVNSFLSIMLSMVFRCISLKTLRFPTSGAFAMCILAYMIPLSMVISIRDIEITSNFTINSNYTLWQLENLDRYRTVVGTSVAQLSTLWVACCVSLLCIPIYSVMFYCRYRILKMLERPGYMFNTTTTLQIKRLVKALTVQSMIPVFTLFPASLIFLSTQFHVIETTKFGYIIISLLSLSPTIDPLVTIYYVQPYRKYIVDLLWFEERPIVSPFLSNNDPRFYRSRSNSVLMMRNTHFV